jgi:hypothetical protein
VQWDASKDKKLWKLIARNPKGTGEEFDWSARAAEFGVDTPFLLQQAAWLYERHFKHVKEQMTRIRASSAVSSPIPGANSVLGNKKPTGKFRYCLYSTLLTFRKPCTIFIIHQIY